MAANGSGALGSLYFERNCLNAMLAADSGFGSSIYFLKFSANKHKSSHVAQLDQFNRFGVRLVQCGLRLRPQDLLDSCEPTDRLHLRFVEFITNLPAFDDLIVKARILCFLSHRLLRYHIIQNGALLVQIPGHVLTLGLGDVKDSVLLRF